MINIHNFGTIFGTILPRFRLTKVEKKQNGCQIKMAAKIFSKNYVKILEKYELQVVVSEILL